MSRSWIIGIVSLTIFCTSVSISVAQSGRSESSSGTATLVDRLAALQSKFRSDEQNASALQKPAKRSAQPNQTKKRKSLLPSISPSNLLPEHFFGRKSSTRPNRETSDAYSEPPQAYDPIESEQVDAMPRAGSNSARSHARRPVTRRLPSTNQTDELETTLADVLPTESAEATDESDGSSFEIAPTPLTRSTSRRARVPSQAFDLHRLLTEDRESEAVAEDSKARAGRSRVVATDETTATDGAKPLVKRSASVFAPRSPVTSKKTYSANPSRNQTTNVTRETVDVEEQTSNDNFSQSYQQPVIVSHVEGPRRIMVGREATYQVTLENTSNTSAKSLAASIHVPHWAEVVDVTSTSGVVKHASQGEEVDVLDWNLSELAAQSSETLHLRLIPHSGQPLALGVQWSQAPIASSTMVEVQEPKLLLDVEGPQEVLFGKPQRYRLTLSNPGTGQAEQVVIRLVPPGGNAQSAITQAIGTLKPGEVRDLDLEFIAREAGELNIQASATAIGGLTAESVKNILCKKPELQVDWRGPETKYAGTTASYNIRVRNPGTANTERVSVQVQLAEGAQFVTASKGYRHNAKTDVVSWNLPGIGAGQEQFMQVRCQVDRPGANVFDVTAQTAEGDLSDSKQIQTEVVALADLKLEVSDPQGPIALNETVLYEIRILNRGKTAAEGVGVIGLFSAGIEPTSVEGAQYSIRDGRVTFHPIKSLPAGSEVVLRIRATANHAGTHVFRAEVACQDLEIKLAAEETTRFFEEEQLWEDSEAAYSAEHSESVTR